MCTIHWANKIYFYLVLFISQLKVQDKANHRYKDKKYVN